jgi:hypothetical protein
MRTILEKNSVYKGGRSVSSGSALSDMVNSQRWLSIQLSVIVEFMAGRITETIERLIALYRPDSLVVGSRGSRSTLKTWSAVFGAPGMGSVSRLACWSDYLPAFITIISFRYCVSHSPVPVIVVQ